jgi:hypothetical protein
MGDCTDAKSPIPLPERAKAFSRRDRVDRAPRTCELDLGRAVGAAGFEYAVWGVTHALDGRTQPLGQRLQVGEQPAHGGLTMAVDFKASRKIASPGTAPALSEFSAMVHIFSSDRYKLSLRLGIGDGAFPKSAKMRQKAPFGLDRLREFDKRRNGAFMLPLAPAKVIAAGLDAPSQQNQVARVR